MTPTDRIIDANANRAREGIRVLEDIARFVLDDPRLSAALKSARHDLRSALAPYGPIIRSRETGSDVGTAISTELESVRGSDSDLVRANAARAQEALRVIEECAKVCARSGSPFERIRYALYDLERDLIASLEPMIEQWPVCVLITKSLCTHSDPFELVEHIAASGVPSIQIREKEMPDPDLFPYAVDLCAHARSQGLSVIINDRVDLALAARADGVHLGHDDMPISFARSILGPGAVIGKTCDRLERIRAAKEQGADYVGVGPVFVSTTKPKDALGGLDLAQQAAALCDELRMPMLAISGITDRTIDDLAKTGARGAAVCSAVCGSSDPRAACERLLAAMSSVDPTVSA